MKTQPCCAAALAHYAACPRYGTLLDNYIKRKPSHHNKLFYHKTANTAFSNKLVRRLTYCQVNPCAPLRNIINQNKFTERSFLSFSCLLDHIIIKHIIHFFVAFPNSHEKELNVPSVQIRNTGQVIQADLVTSILVALQMNGVQIETRCGGKAQCGRCAIRIHSGREHLTRKSQRENIRLSALKAGEDIRLACQTYTRGSIEIEIINMK